MALVSMPAFAPLYVPGEEVVNVRWLTLVYEVERHLAHEVLPAPLAPADVPQLGVWIAEFEGASFRLPDGRVESRPVYLQGGVSLSCTHEGFPGAYALETFVAGHNYGLLGRELFGLPKKQARAVELQDEDGTLHYSIATANGQRLLHGKTGALSTVEASSPAPPWFATHFTAKVIPSAEGNAYDVNKLVRLPWTFSGPEQTRVGSGTYEWATSSSDPIHLFGERGDARATYGRSRLEINYGTYVAELAQHHPLGQQQWQAREDLP